MLYIQIERNGCYRFRYTGPLFHKNWIITSAHWRETGWNEWYAWTFPSETPKIPCRGGWGLKFQVSSLLCFSKGTSLCECEPFTEVQGMHVEHCIVSGICCDLDQFQLWFVWACWLCCRSGHVQKDLTCGMGIISTGLAKWFVAGCQTTCLYVLSHVLCFKSYPDDILYMILCVFRKLPQINAKVYGDHTSRFEWYHPVLQLCHTCHGSLPQNTILPHFHSEWQFFCITVKSVFFRTTDCFNFAVSWVL